MLEVLKSRTCDFRQSHGQEIIAVVNISQAQSCVCMCIFFTVLLEARYNSNPPGDSVLKSKTMEVEVARKDF